MSSIFGVKDDKKTWVGAVFTYTYFTFKKMKFFYVYIKRVISEKKDQENMKVYICISSKIYIYIHQSFY